MATPKESYPVSYEAERTLLAAMMTHQEAHVEGLGMVHPNDFMHPDHKTIFQIAGELFHKGDTVDMVTVSVAYRKIKGKSSPVVADLFKDSFVGIGSYPAHIRVVKDLSRRRVAVAAFQEATEKLNGSIDTDEVISELITNLQTNVGTVARRPVPLEKVVPLTLKRIELALEKKSKVTGIPTGYRVFDDLVGGIQPGELMVVGSRPSIGKSALLAGICLGAARQGHATMIVNAEMELVEVGTRMLANASGIPNFSLRRGVLQDEDFIDLTKAAGKLSTLPVWIYDDTRWDVIKTQVRAMKAQRPDLGIVAIDYVQRIRANKERGEQRYEVLGKIAREAKDLAKDLRIAVILAAQLSRSVEKEGKEPQLSDFRECGDLEQRADMASFLHCYNPKKDPTNIYWWLRKNRNGPLATIHFRFIGDAVAFRDWDGAKDE